jgi:hypothetical protein
MQSVHEILTGCLNQPEHNALAHLFHDLKDPRLKIAILDEHARNRALCKRLERARRNTDTRDGHFQTAG